MDVYEQLSSSSSSSYGLPVYLQLHMTWKKEEEIDTGQQLRRRKRRSKAQGDVGDSTGRAYILFRPTYMALLLFFISPFFVVVEKRRAQKPVFIFIFFLTYPLCVFWLETIYQLDNHSTISDCLGGFLLVLKKKKSHTKRRRDAFRKLREWTESERYARKYQQLPIHKLQLRAVQ